VKTKNRKLSDIPLEVRAEEALKKAVAHTIADHKRTGDPIVIWRDGKVVKIPADQIEVREPRAEYSRSGRGKK
jgi:ABC-type proline/glycine betaine transport system ATPase subunit